MFAKLAKKKSLWHSVFYAFLSRTKFMYDQLSIKNVYRILQSFLKIYEWSYHSWDSTYIILRLLLSFTTFEMLKGYTKKIQIHVDFCC